MSLDYEIRNDPVDNPENLDDATRAVNELRTGVEEFRSQLDQRLADHNRALGDRLAAIETRLNRPAPAAPRNPDELSPELRAFNSYLRMGDRAPAEEIRTLIASSDPQGGYLTPPEVSTEFIRNLVLFSPIRSLATVRATAADTVTYPKRTSITNAKWKGETQTQESSQPGFGQVDVPIRELNTYVDLSNQLMADSGGAASREVSLALSEDFGAKEGLAFVKGAGPLQPEGLLTNADVGYMPTGNAATLGSSPSDLLITFYYSLPAPYRTRGTWLMNGGTLAAIRKFKTATTNEYIWQPAYSQGQPETILGRPVVEIPDMDDVGSGTTPIMFGDIATAYRIVDRVALSILVNPYIRATEGITRIHATRRVGAAVVQPAAVKKLTCAVS